MRWGLVPFWAKGVPTKYSTINARSEKMKEAASYRGPWKSGQRCLFVCSGFYEWQVVTGQKGKQPWFVRLPTQETFAMGGLWERSEKEDGSVVLSATIVTMPANELMAEVHNDKKRMPLILDPENFNPWLGEDADLAEGSIEPYPSVKMEAWPVSAFVNKPANNDPRCIAKFQV